MNDREAREFMSISMGGEIGFCNLDAIQIAGDGLLQIKLYPPEGMPVDHMIEQSKTIAAYVQEQVRRNWPARKVYVMVSLDSSKMTFQNPDDAIRFAKHLETEARLIRDNMTGKKRGRGSPRPKMTARTEKVTER